MKKIYMLTVAATLALGACSIFEDAPESTMVPVQISATIGESALSRASNESWAKGDEIGITLAMGEEAKQVKQVNIKYTTDGGETFNGATPIYFYNQMTLTAYYPFAGDDGKAPGILEVETNTENQNSDKQPKIDFLWAKTSDYYYSDKDDKPEPVVNFKFTHKMSKLTFIFKNGDGTDLSKVPITTYTLDELVLDGTFDPATGECKPKPNGNPETLKIELKGLTGEEDVTGEEGVTSEEDVTDVKNEVAVPPLIVFPQKLEKALTLTITDSQNQSYQCTLPIPEGGSLKEGNNYQFTIKVSKTGLTVNKPTINPWNDKDVTTEDGEDPEASSVVLKEGE